jgi:uncharacterized cupredoxin-like copper-binding protein
VIDMTKGLSTTAFALAAATLAIAGCGGSSDNSSSTKSSKTTAATKTSSATASAGAGSTVSLSAATGGKIAFDKKTLSAKAGKVTLDMKNPSSSGIPHAVAVEGQGVDKDGATAQPGSSSKVTVTLKPGKYEFYCPVDGHKQQGMKGTLTVQ